MYRKSMKSKSKSTKKCPSTNKNKLQINLSQLSDSSTQSEQKNVKPPDHKLKSLVDNDKLIIKDPNFLSETETDTNSNKQKNLDTELAVKDKVLSTNCLELRQIIINKTRQLFDQNNDFYHKTDKILRATEIINNNNNSNGQNVISSPRRTRSFKNLLTTKPNVNNCEESLNISNIGVPISCSTFTTCDVQESCNLPSTSVLKPNTSILNTPQAKINITRVKPSVKNVQMCNYNLLNNKRNQTDKNTIIHQQTMELTPVQGNCILNKTNNKIPDANRFSMDVNTSLDNIYHKRPEDDNGDGENEVGGKKNSKHGHMAIIDEENDEDGRFSDNKLGSIHKLISDKESLECDTIEGTPEQTQQSQLRRNISRLLGQKTSVASKNDDKGRDGLDNTIILDDLTLDKNPKVTDKGTIIIDETSEDSDSDADRNKMIMETVKKKLNIGKRRLFTQHNSPVSLSPLSPMPSSLSPAQVKKPIRRRRRIRRNATQTVFTRSQVNSINHGTRVSTSSLGESNFQAETQRKKIIEEMEEEKKNKKKRIIKSKKIVCKKANKCNLLSLVSQKIDKNGAGARAYDNNNDAGDNDSPMSSNVFMENKRLAKKSRNHSKSIIIVATGLCNGDKDIVREAIKKIGGAKMESTVSKKTTHVVTTGVRTINLLRGIIRGCWVLKFEWIKNSIEASEWLPPDKYEIEHFSKVLKENRRDREIFGSSYIPELFTASGLIHIQNNTTPPQNVLKELIKTAGGYTIDDPKNARIIIGPTGLKELWVLDSITTGELQPIDQYKR